MIRMIAAIDRKLGLAKQGIQPWFIPADQKRFYDQTLLHGGNILVGGITFHSIFNNRPLPKRQNFVLTREKAPIEGVELVHDLENFLRDWQDKDLWIIGGANVFAQIMEQGEADELCLTHIEADFGCNQFFPSFKDTFKLAEQSDLHEQNGFIFSYARYSRAATE